MPMKIQKGSTVWFHGKFYGRRYTCLRGTALEEGETGVARSINVLIPGAFKPDVLVVPGCNIYIVKDVNLPA